MGWFGKQIEKRRLTDDQMLEDSYVRIAEVVMGKSSAARIEDDRTIAKNTIDEILKYFRYKPADIPDNIKDIDAQLDYCLAPRGVLRRKVELTEGWYKDSFGPVLAFTREEGKPVALLPAKTMGYYYKDHLTGRKVRINSRNAGNFDIEGYCFYRPLPQRAIGISDLLIYMKNCINLSDVVMLIIATAAVALTGLFIPQITKILTGPVISSRRADVLAASAVCIVCISLSTQLISSIRELVQQRIGIKTGMGVQSAVMMRLMSLPASFFRSYSPGELRTRAMSVGQLCSMMMQMIMGTGLTSIASLVYIPQIFNFAPGLTVPAILIVLTTLAFSVITTFVQIRIDKKRMEHNSKESGMTYSLITGVQKIKLAGAEKRVFSKWMNLFAQGAELSYNPPVFIKINSVISTAITLISNIILYYMAIRSNVDQSSYFAFTSAYGMLMGAFTSLSAVALSAARIKPVLEMAEPFLKTEPETEEGRETVTGISGGVELDHVSFRYGADSPYIFKDLSLKIRPGEYVAIAGKTGCGKSTIVRLLLGFEKPETGAVYYDGKDLQSFDPGSLRRKIGTVMQDAGLFSGDIYSNIVITAPELTVKDAWEAAEKAGIAEDIRMMPMGMNTVISEGSGGISGGQRQRIMIARAIAPKPNLLIFDEATSALDNKTQRQVSEALDAMGCTRIVIAHRLSTIKHCDRILVIDEGKIVEDGTYDELIEQGGYFAELVARQRLDT